MTENVETVYDSNWVEGMKANFDVALYDAYLSSRIVTYTNNTWKNNIVFSADKTDNTLIKSKQAGVGGDLGDNTPIESRYYANNTFIVEEAFAQRLGQPTSTLFVWFMDLTTYAENYTIENNKFDVYDLRFPVASKRINNFKFNNNDLKAKYAIGRLAMIRLTDTTRPTIEINSNTINIEQNGAYPSGQTDGFQLVRITDTRTSTTNGLAKSITVKDNVIHAPLTYIFHTPLADTMTVQNNRITVASSLFKMTVFSGNHPELANIPISKY